MVLFEAASELGICNIVDSYNSINISQLGRRLFDVAATTTGICGEVIPVLYCIEGYFTTLGDYDFRVVNELAKNFFGRRSTNSTKGFRCLVTNLLKRKYSAVILD